MSATGSRNVLEGKDLTAKKRRGEGMELIPGSWLLMKMRMRMKMKRRALGRP
jgi:hypothetical protein